MLHKKGNKLHRRISNQNHLIKIKLNFARKMDKTFLNSTVSVNELRAEEKEYSEEIYRNLHSIKTFQIHFNRKPTDEFNKCFTKVLKPTFYNYTEIGFKRIYILILILGYVC